MQLSEADSSRVLRPPRLNGRYVVTRLLGKGAQARVYLAMDARLKQWRAVKVLAPDYVTDHQVRVRFDNEARAMARMSHRNLLRILDIDSDGELPFIVMELARAGAVTDWLKRHGPMPPHLAIDVIRQACDGLAHAHHLGVVHRDVKPHNLLISDDGRILLTDFGIAQLGEDASLTQTGSVLGTFAYMAPEQRNDTKSVDTRTDVYALGATLYTCLTLRTSAELFFAENRDDILDGIPEELALVILDACRYDREDRIPSVEALRDRLLESVGGLTETECPPINSAVMPVPDRPPKVLGMDSGVADLADLLSVRALDDETVIPRSPAEMLFEEQSTTLYSDTGYDDDDADFQFADDSMPPKRMEPGDGGATQPSEVPDAAWAQRGTADGLYHPDLMTTAGFTTRPNAMKRGEFDHDSVRRPFAELSEEDAPSYVDVSTLDRPKPTIEGPPHPRVTSSVAGRRRSPVVPPSIHTAEPAAVRRAREEADRLPYGLYAGMAVMFALTLFVSWGIVEKAFTSWQAREAGRQLLQAVHEQQLVIAELDAAGLDRSPLEVLWYEIQDAEPGTRAPHAAAFADAVANEAERLQLRGIPGAQAAQLRLAEREWSSAKSRADGAREALTGRVTGSLGVFAY